MPASTKPVSAAAHAPLTKPSTALPALDFGAMIPKLPFAGVLAQLDASPPQRPLAMPPMAPMPKPTVVVPVRPETERKTHASMSDDDLDPMARQAAQLAPPPIAHSDISQEKAVSAPETCSRMSLEELVPQLVKRISWSGDVRGGTVRMELGAGDLAGSILTVSSDNGRVSVSVRAPAGTDTTSWRSRLAARLQARGLSVDSIEFT